MLHGYKPVEPKRPVMSKDRQQQRFERECKEINAQVYGISGIKLLQTPFGRNAQSVKCLVKGPEDTVFDGGEFEVGISVWFVTPIWHPNISSLTGYICLDILKTQWTPSISFISILKSIQLLMSEPNADDAQDEDVAKQFQCRRGEYDRQAREWTRDYAKPGDPKTYDRDTTQAPTSEEESTAVALRVQQKENTAAGAGLHLGGFVDPSLLASEDPDIQMALRLQQEEYQTSSKPPGPVVMGQGGVHSSLTLSGGSSSSSSAPSGSGGTRQNSITGATGPPAGIRGAHHLPNNWLLGWCFPGGSRN
uniref:UBC core domain-containing protein n=1 Tax=Chromera velia CCMP2878 TaxID=1169474 RepID=A0A0G4IEU6_9ALVE|eukprot:Cvel_13765.t1-p1 / transcript=Cvel_13765.t1 / gene=Cvel_13765 / organism=Chromera_velia_CCMP2878 / gene_product=Probable ubiquitin-conjugating enzyme E2 21, putative / transcript_product=Probable ubiquitin-conjugating enzyme E2 21, putative / location=Cvel_scaffold953:43867-45389(+) / protein_length=305 / sequence_SO=supercontig / SO=protein_coding / is_pseudo=false